MADLATLQSRLAEAEEALHALASGKADAQEIQFEGRVVRYTPRSMDDLRSYIDWLRLEISKESNVSQPRVFTIQSNRGLR